MHILLQSEIEAEAIDELRKERIGHVTFLARGHRGWVFLGKLRGKLVAIKFRNPKSTAPDTIHKEAQFLELLNLHRIGPKLHFYQENFIVMEYIAGKRIEDFLADGRSIFEVMSVISRVLAQCLLMDTLNISKEEMSNPYKHVIVRKTKEGYRPVLIDFERAHKTLRPQNVTQFFQYLLHIEKKLPDGLHLNREMILNTMKSYHTTRDFQTKLFDIFKFQRTTYQELVWKEALGIPSGNVVNYAQIAERVGGSPRAVGNALCENPFAPLVPCHRVIKKSGVIGGYHGSLHTQEKKDLLLLEGIKIKDGKVSRQSRKTF
jgi:O-6-methylguanine DNA methyltransferase